MTTIPIEPLGMVVQSLQKTWTGLAKDPRRTQPVHPPGQFLKSRERHHLYLAQPGKVALCKKIGILVPHPTPTTLPSTGVLEKEGKEEKGRVSTFIKVLPLIEDRGKLCTNFKLVHPHQSFSEFRLRYFEK
jgi:hypothetical protein